MINRIVRRFWSAVLLLSVSGSLLTVAGCGDDTVRGAGSIDVPKPAALGVSAKGTALRGKTAGLPSRGR